MTECNIKELILYGIHNTAIHNTALLEGLRIKTHMFQIPNIQIWSPLVSKLTVLK